MFLRSSFRHIDYPSDRPGPCSCHSDLKRKKNLTRYLTKINIWMKNSDFITIVDYFRSKNYLRNLTKNKNLRVLYSRHPVERNVTDRVIGRIIKSGMKETRKCVWSRLIPSKKHNNKSRENQNELYFNVMRVKMMIFLLQNLTVYWH